VRRAKAFFNWKGLIDEVAIYDTALTPAQIRGHFRASQAAPPSLTIEKAVIVLVAELPARLRVAIARATSTGLTPTTRQHLPPGRHSHRAGADRPRPKILPALQAMS